MALRTISLCSGIGGLDLGLEYSGISSAVCYVEGEAYAASTLAARMEEGHLAQAPIWSDVTTFDAASWRGAVDLVTGGYPCQPFSYAGKRLGDKDPRHLWPHVLRVFRESGARYLFCENVAGHLSLGFQEVLEDLARMGCSAEWGVFASSDLGARHRRARLFFLADTDPGRCQGERGPRVSNRQSECWGDSNGRGSQVPPVDGELGLAPTGLWPSLPKSSVRGVAHRPSPRVDRLRALGNTVDPALAAAAFRHLWKSLNQSA